MKHPTVQVILAYVFLVGLTSSSAANTPENSTLPKPITEAFECLKNTGHMECFSSVAQDYHDYSYGLSHDELVRYAKEFVEKLESLCGGLSDDSAETCYRQVWSKSNWLARHVDPKEASFYKEKAREAYKHLPPPPDTPLQDRIWRVLGKAKHAKTNDEFQEVGEELLRLKAEGVGPEMMQGFFEDFIIVGKSRGFTFVEPEGGAPVLEDGDLNKLILRRTQIDDASPHKRQEGATDRKGGVLFEFQKPSSHSEGSGSVTSPGSRAPGKE